MAAPTALKVTGRYGKGNVNVFRVQKNEKDNVHEILDTDIEVSLEGNFVESYTVGDNNRIVPTDTCKNICYVVSRQKNFKSIEDYGLALARHFVREYGHVDKAMIHLKENLWSRVNLNGETHDHAFIAKGPEFRTATVIVERTGRTSVTSGIKNMKVLKTTQSGFTDYHLCQHTTLPPSTDRIFATSVEADFHYTPGAVLPEGQFHKIMAEAKESFLQVFGGPAKGGVYSKSVQETMFLMGRKVLDREPSIGKIDLFLPNIHHFLFDVSRFGLKNNNEIFFRSDSPSGFIRCTIDRSQQSKL